MARRIPMGQKKLLRSKMLEMVQQGQTTLKAATITFGPTLAAEKLSEIEGIKISVSVLRRLLIEAVEWKSKRRVKKYRSRRDRHECFGELIQFDGSHHKWLEGRGPSCCLMTMIGDAANVRLARFFEQETIEAAMSVFSLWINSYGIPQALYCDKKNAFVLTREPTDAELLAGVSTIACANAFLADYYLPKINGKFSRHPADAADAHAPLEGVNLKDIFCYEILVKELTNTHGQRTRDAA